MLAVGDAAFQQRCLDEFQRLRDEGRTIVLVTHDMTMVERFCHRAMLLTDGEIELIGDPHEVGRRYVERELRAVPRHARAEGAGALRLPRRKTVDKGSDRRRLGRGRNRQTSRGRPPRRHCCASTRPSTSTSTCESPSSTSGSTTRRTRASSPPARAPWTDQPPLEPGDSLHVTVETKNILRDGRYHIGCSLLSGSAALDIVALVNRHKQFHSYGAEHVYGLIEFAHDAEGGARARDARSPPEAQEIRGPSAYGGGWKRFAHLTWLIAITDYRLTYFGSALGYLWSLMRPLMLFGVLYVVFSKFLKFGNDIPNYRDLLLMNIVLFTFFSEATGQSVRVVAQSRDARPQDAVPAHGDPALDRGHLGMMNLAANLVAVFLFIADRRGRPALDAGCCLPLLLIPLIAVHGGRRDDPQSRST